MSKKWWRAHKPSHKSEKVNVALLLLCQQSPSPVRHFILLYLPGTWQETGRLHAGHLHRHGGPRAKPGFPGELVLKALASPHVGEGKACFPPGHERLRGSSTALTWKTWQTPCNRSSGSSPLIHTGSLFFTSLSAKHNTINFHFCASAKIS